MDISNNVVLITGRATGIGFALAKAFVSTGNKVIVCGRRADRLKVAAASLPGLETTTCDMFRKSQREALFRWTKEHFPGLNVLVNNAGIQRAIDFTRGRPRTLRRGERGRD